MTEAPDLSILLHFEDGRTQRMPPTTLDRVFLLDRATIRRFDRCQATLHYVEVSINAAPTPSPSLVRSARTEWCVLCVATLMLIVAFVTAWCIVAFFRWVLA